VVFDVIILYEVWLGNENMDANTFQIPNYSLYFSNLNENQNNGVKVFINNLIALISSIDNLVQTYTAIEIFITKWNSTFLIYTIYRSPKNNIESFIDELENLILFNFI
jgi:hypothetical protein